MKKAKRGLVLKTETIQQLTSELHRVVGGGFYDPLATLLCSGERAGKNPSTDAACTN